MVWLLVQCLGAALWAVVPCLFATPVFWYLLLRDLLCALYVKFHNGRSQERVPRTPDTPNLTRVKLLTPSRGASESRRDLEADMNGASKELPSVAKAAAAAASRSGFFSVAPPQSPSHLWGVPRRLTLTTVGAFAHVLTSMLNRTRVHNKQRLIDLVRDRPPGTPLITISNHTSTLDDPLMWGLWGVRASDPKLCRWTLTAKDICFIHPVLSYFFRIGKCVPVDRWGGLHQPAMQEALELINKGEWLHTFPEGRCIQTETPIQRLKWGVSSLIARASVQPLILCVAHSGYQNVMPEETWYGGRSLLPLGFKKISIVVGEPFQFDIPALWQAAQAATASGACVSPARGPSGLWLREQRALWEEERKRRAAREGGAERGKGEGPSPSTPPTPTLEVGIVRKEAGPLPPYPIIPPPEPGQELAEEEELLAGSPEEVEEKAKALAEEEAARARKMAEAGDAATQWMYAQMSEHIRQKLNDLVFEAHERNR